MYVCMHIDGEIHGIRTNIALVNTKGRKSNFEPNAVAHRLKSFEKRKHYNVIALYNRHSCVPRKQKIRSRVSE